MKKLNFEELERVNGGAAQGEETSEKRGDAIVYAKDGVSIMMSIEDFDWLVSQYGIEFAQMLTSKEIAELVVKRHFVLKFGGK